MIRLRNALLDVSIHPKGAELARLYHKHHQIDYLWKGDPAFWGKHSPVLFPIVGALRNQQYRYEGKMYTLGRHGFARDQVFEYQDMGAEEARFVLRDSPATRAVYPFHFQLTLHYRLQGARLILSYEVAATGPGPLYFSIGAHPAFAVPIDPQLQYEDYALKWELPETASRWPITEDGLIKPDPIPLLENSTHLPLSHGLFYADALVLKGLSIQQLTLGASGSERGLRFSFAGFPYLGLWAARNAEFICIEPWCGIADAENSNQELTDKEGIQFLEAGQQFERSWSVELF